MWRPGDGKQVRFDVAVVHWCFSEGGDSILSPSLGSICERSCKTIKEFLWLANLLGHMISQNVHVGAYTPSAIFAFNKL